MKSTTASGGIAFILHEATRTGAPRLGALIARELARDEDVRVIVMKDGPLAPWLRETLDPRRLTILRDDPFQFRQPFEGRVALAERLLDEADCDLVYANSLAASVFVLAAAKQGRKSILHVHEKSADMLNLLACEVTKLDLPALADAAVLAADDIAADLAAIFPRLPGRIEKFGVAVEVEAIREAAKAQAQAPRNALGATLSAGDRLLVGMCGNASKRKGADIFLGAAAALPEVDFLWIGAWRPEETSDNAAYPAYAKARPANVYLAGAVDNPYPYLAMLDLFFLSSREDPNPLVIAEAIVLGVPLLAFSRTTAIADRLGRCGILCYGDPNVEDAVRAIRASAKPARRRPAIGTVGAGFVADYDLKAKTPKLRHLIASLRGRAATGVLPDEAVRREIGEGVVELTFS